MSFVKSLFLTNYRNHRSLALQFGNSVNLIVGGNAQGKTNILESIYFLGRGRSFRSQDSNELISWGEAEGRIEAVVEKIEGIDRARASLSGSHRVLELNGKRKRDLGVSVVLFVPQNITIFRDLPSERRRYLNEFIFGLDDIYRNSYRSYVKVLAHRNRILKIGQDEGWERVEEEQEIWNEKLIFHGVEVTISRKKWVDRINDRIEDIYWQMGGVGKGVKIEYLPHIREEGKSVELREIYKERLDARKELERIRGVSLVGPHRDDWKASVEGSGLKASGSQGQMRVMAIALKMVELELTNIEKGRPPILLLDDVISELDGASTEKLLQFVARMDGQVFITSTEEDLLIRRFKDQAKIFTVTKENVGVY